MVTCNQATTYLEEPAMTDMYGKSYSDGKFRDASAYSQQEWSDQIVQIDVFIASYFAIICNVVSTVAATAPAYRFGY